jgi:hypothetical protein
MGSRCPSRMRQERRSYVASSGSSKLWLHLVKEPWRLHSGVTVYFHVTSHLYQFALCTQSWWECGSGWSRLLWPRGAANVCEQYYNGVFHEHQSPTEQWVFATLASTVHTGYHELVALIVHELLGRWEGYGLHSGESPSGQLYGQQGCPATGQPNWSPWYSLRASALYLEQPLQQGQASPI